MATKYLLPCECGQTIPIEVSQAGQPVRCDCGITMEAPSMRAIRSLEAVAEGPPPKQEAAWNPLAGSVFVAGAILVVAGLIVVGYSSFSVALLKRNLPVRSDDLVNQWLGEIDNGTAEDLLQIWNDTLSRGLQDADDSPWALFRRESWKFGVAGGFGLGAITLGTILGIISIFLRRQE